MTKRKEYMVKWRANNMDKIRAYDRKRYSEDSGPKIDRANKYYANNREEVKAKKRAYYLANRDKYIAQSKEQKLINPEKYRAYSRNANKRARELKAGRPQAPFCEVCNAAKKTYFDHDHSTGKFRGWICLNCNTALGHVRDDVEVLKKLILYLEISRGSPKLEESIKSPIQII